MDRLLVKELLDIKFTINFFFVEICHQVFFSAHDFRPT